MTEQERKLHSVSYKTNTLVLAALLFLTVLTVVLSRFDLGALDVVITIIVATIKSFLIVYYFMYLKYERTIFTFVLLLCFFLLSIAIGMTFLDIGWRY